MESSRGGPLTTFIMMLPLIVVPTIAMLRPINQEGSLLSDLLSATTSPGREADPATDPGAALDPLEELFSEHPETTSDQHSPFAIEDETTDNELDADLFAEVSEASLPADFPRHSGGLTPPPPADHGSVTGLDRSGDPRADELLAQLKKMGANRTLWFSPGGRSVGFVAFFQAGAGTVYRFGSVADSRVAAVRDVLQQALEWQGKHRR